MYALVEFGGEQFRVEQGKEINSQFQKGDVGTEITIDKVLMIGDGDSVTIGQPTVSGATVRGTITKQFREPKIIVFKKKRRKGYRVKNGHRQHKTTIRIDNIEA